MKKTIRVAALALALATAVAGCGEAPSSDGGNGSGATSTGSPSSPSAGAGFLGCMVSDSGGIDDRSFNQSAYDGLKKVEKDLGIGVKFVESKADADYGPNINSLVSDDCGIIVTVGFLMGDATSGAATAHTDEKFAIVDSAPETPIENVKPLSFNTAQAAFLGGYLAAGMTKSGTVATFGGAKIPPVTIFMDGFVDGVAYYNTQKGKTVKVLGWDKAKQNGSFTGDFDDQNKGRQLAQNFISQGADIVLPVAGPVGLGAAAAAKASGGKANLIWVDADGYVAAPQYKDLFISSILKRVDNAVEAATRDAVDDKFTNAPYVGTLANEGVALAPFHSFEGEVPEELAAEIDEVRQGIIDGSVTVESPSAPK